MKSKTKHLKPLVFACLSGCAGGNVFCGGFKWSLAPFLLAPFLAPFLGPLFSAPFLDNTDDYLPAGNPKLWQAKAGSDAAGKMDMLSVLLHEYGHALGLEHSTNSGDFMAATLKPGQRRLALGRRSEGRDSHQAAKHQTFFC